MNFLAIFASRSSIFICGALNFLFIVHANVRSNFAIPSLFWSLSLGNGNCIFMPHFLSVIGNVLAAFRKSVCNTFGSDGWYTISCAGVMPWNVDLLPSTQTVSPNPQASEPLLHVSTTTICTSPASTNPLLATRSPHNLERWGLRWLPCQNESRHRAPPNQVQAYFLLSFWCCAAELPGLEKEMSWGKLASETQQFCPLAIALKFLRYRSERSDEPLPGINFF